MELHLNLESLKFANVVNFNRTYGTKKTSTENGGSLTTYEFNNNNALPFDIQRPYIITEDSTVTDVQYDGKLLINANNTTVTLGTGTDGITLTVASLYNATITDGAVNYSIRAGQTLQFMYFDTSWHNLTEGEYFGTVADATTQIIDVAVSNYTGKKLPEGARLHIVFSSDYSYDGQPSFTINGGTERVPVTVGNVPAGIGAFQQDKSYEFIFTGSSYDCLSKCYTPVVLWKNPSPSEGFSPQKISFKNMGFSHYLINAISQPGEFITSNIIKVGNKGLLNFCGGAQNIVYGDSFVMNRPITASSNNSVTFGICAAWNGGSYYNQFYDRMIPQQIIGLYLDK